jgi:hypothetical protein
MNDLKNWILIRKKSFGSATLTLTKSDPHGTRSSETVLPNDFAALIGKISLFKKFLGLETYRRSKIKLSSPSIS